MGLLTEKTSKPFNRKTNPASVYSTLRANRAETDSQSFEETYKTAYSHGLEAIYALENVDLKTVRKIGESTPKPAAEAKAKVKTLRKSSEQLELDLGVFWRGWLDSFTLHEPIQALGLSKHAERCLLEHGKSKIGDLIDFDLKSLVFVKGFGQGHIDEVQQKLSHYLKDKSLDRAFTVDFYSLINAIIGDLDRRKAYVYLQDLALDGLIQLSPAESMEVRRLTLEKKIEWQQEAKQQLQSGERAHFAHRKMEEIFEAFIKPWICSKHGIATESEVLERLENVSDQPHAMGNVLAMLQSLYYKGKQPLQRYLKEVDDKLYAASSVDYSAYHRIREKAFSYFYKHDLKYNFDELAIFIKRELAKQWEGYSCEAISRILKICPDFFIYRESSGILLITLA